MVDVQLCSKYPGFAVKHLWKTAFSFLLETEDVIGGQQTKKAVCLMIFNTGGVVS